MPPELLRVGLTVAGSYALAYLLTPLVRQWAIAVGCVAKPAKDRWGRRVVPRLGGLPIGLAFLAALGWGALQDIHVAGLAAAGLLILVVGLIDDFKRLPPHAKLTAQILAGCLVLLSGIRVDLANSWLTIPVTIGWLVLTMNAFNLLDNMDGLSAGIGMIAAGFLTWHTVQTGQGVVAVVSASLVGALLGFLRYNLPPAKIFMGDTGSQTVGLGLGALSLMGTWHQPARLLGILALPTLLLAVPIFDTLFVTIERLIHGRHPFQGGTDHLSHRLGVLGLNPRQVVFALYGLAAAFGLLSLFLIDQNPITIAGIWLLAIGVLLMLGAYLAKVRVYAGPPPAYLESKATFVETMLTHKRRLLEAVVDFILICACYVVAHALRFEGNLTLYLEVLILRSLPWVIGVKMVCFFACGLYQGVWRYVTLSDLVTIFKSVVLGSLFSAVVVLYLWRFEGYSRAVFLIDGMLLFIAIGGSRLCEPLLNEWLNHLEDKTRKVLIIGAGDTGELILRQLKMERGGDRRAAAFLDDDPTIQGNRIHGVPILGSSRELGKVVQELGISEVFIAMENPPRDLVAQIRSYCKENGLYWKIARSLASNEPSPQFNE